MKKKFILKKLIEKKHLKELKRCEYEFQKFGFRNVESLKKEVK